MRRVLPLLLILTSLLAACGGSPASNAPVETALTATSAIASPEPGAGPASTDTAPTASTAGTPAPEAPARASQSASPRQGTPAIAGSATPVGPPVVLLASPWKPGERLAYTITTKATGQLAGQAVFTLGREFEADSLSAKITIGATTDSFLMGFNTKTLRPVSETRTIVTASGETTIRSEFHSGGATIEVTDARGTRRAVLNLPDEYFANDQFLTLLRALPFATGYRGVVTVVPSRGSPASLPATIAVVGQETIATGLGPLLAWRVEADFGGAAQVMWYGVDAPHALLRYDNDKYAYVLNGSATP